jgi:predicted ATP-dependent serine protease
MPHLRRASGDNARAMARDKTIYTCSACGGTNPQWLGKCPHCGDWNTLEEGSLRSPGAAIAIGGQDAGGRHLVEIEA